MSRNRRPRGKKTEHDNPKQGRAEECLNSPDPSNDPQVHLDRRRTITHSSGSPSPQDDSLSQAGACDHAPTPAPESLKPDKSDNTYKLSPPSTSTLHFTAVRSIPQRFTLDALLQVAEIVETLRDKAAASGVDTDDHLGAAERSSRGTGDRDSRGSTTAPSDQSGSGGPHSGPDGGPALPPAHGEHEQ